MKTKFYFLTIFVFLALAVSAQKYNVLLIEDWTNNSWVNSLKTSNTYDSNGNLIKLTTQEWNAQTNSWDNSAITSNTLNSDGTIKETFTQAWVADSSAWKNASKTIFMYSASKKKLAQTTQLWFGNAWKDFAKNVYTYNNNDLLTTEVSQTMNFLTMELKNTLQNTYTYNSDGTENQQMIQTWNELNQWVNSKRTTNTFNASKHVTSSLGEKWENNAWINDSRSTFTYNANGSIIESMEESWLVNAWINTSKEMFSYNTNGALEQFVSQAWNTTIVQWENKLRITYDFNSTGIDPIKLTGKASVVFPNPFEDHLTIESGSLDEHRIQVFNDMGQMINEFKTHESVTNLNLGGLKKGVYFMKIKSSQNEQTVKLLKAR